MNRPRRCWLSHCMDGSRCEDLQLFASTLNGSFSQPLSAETVTFAVREQSLTFLKFLSARTAHQGSKRSCSCRTHLRFFPGDDQHESDQVPSATHQRFRADHINRATIQSRRTPPDPLC